MFTILLWPLTAFCSLVARGPLVAIAVGCALCLLAFVTRHGAWGAGFAMFVGFVLIWMSESAARMLPEQGVVAGD
ncbi:MULTISPECIES: hypothetical protein [Roseomonadaceae]|uniref:Uncharacterized protein n=1 Tax=Falsiroseomonas oleicola TaxID=2801474 RepID=A0ABS6H9V1_9PROT|nr:hypothetical protein [Roseomonas oleicola]MBU8545492.1 hypothetical protein [Roseomonas oleicola]